MALQPPKRGKPMENCPLHSLRLQSYNKKTTFCQKRGKSNISRHLLHWMFFSERSVTLSFFTYLCLVADISCLACSTKASDFSVHNK